MDGKVVEQLLPPVLPITALVVVPALIPYASGLGAPSPALNNTPWLIAGSALSLTGLLIMAVTIRLPASMCRGTLAPWRPTTRVVTSGIYTYARNHDNQRAAGSAGRVSALLVFADPTGASSSRQAMPSTCAALR